MKKNRKLPMGVLIALGAFGAALLLVTAVAYRRASGNTGLDMAKIHQMRLKSNS